MQVSCFVDAECIIVAATASIIKFLEAHKRPICKDQFLRLAAVRECESKAREKGGAKRKEASKDEEKADEGKGEEEPRLSGKEEREAEREAEREDRTVCGLNSVG